MVIILFNKFSKYDLERFGLFLSERLSKRDWKATNSSINKIDGFIPIFHHSSADPVFLTYHLVQIVDIELFFRIVQLIQ